MLRLKDPKGVKRFQKAHGLTVTGHLDRATKQKVRLHNTNASRTLPAKKHVDPLQHAANMQAVAEYAPQIKDAKGQIASSGQQLSNIGNWYQDYINKVQAAQQQTADAYSNAENNLIRQGGQSDTADRAAADALTQKMAQDAAARGATVDPSIQATANQAASSRQAALSTLLAQMGGEGASSTAAFAARGAVATGTKAQALKAEQNRGVALKQALADLKSQRTAKAQVDLGQLQKDQLNAQIAEQGLGIKVGQLGVNKQNARTSRLAAKSLATNRKRTLKQTRKHQSRQDSVAQQNANTSRYRATHPSKSSKPKFTSTQRHATKSKLRTLVGQVNQVKSRTSSAQAYNNAVARNVDPLLARAAVQLAYGGGVSPKIAKRLKREFGINARVATTRTTVNTASGVANQVAGSLPSL